MSGRRARLGAAAIALGALAAPAAAHAALAAPVTIDGPGAVVALDGVALAQDGSGAVVYRKDAGAAAHVFVSLESSGAWAAPVQLDAAIAAGASASAVAVAAGGRVAAVWIAGGTLYGAVHAAGSSGFTAPQQIAAASGRPALGMSPSGTAYVAFAAPAAGGASDVDVARLDRSSTSFAALDAPMTAAPVTLADAGGPSIAVSADATAVVAWAQQQPDGSTHVLVRRASAAGPSPVTDDATVTTLDGTMGGDADSPAVGVAWDSSDAWVAFRESFGATSRVVVTELLGDELRTPAFADSLGAGGTPPASALAPSLAVNGNDAGLLASELSPDDSVSVAALGSPAAPSAWTPGAVANPAPDGVSPAPVAALSSDGDGAVAYAPSAGALAAELFVDGGPTGSLTLSDAALGGVDVADGVCAAADDAGDLVLGYVAGAAGALSLVVQPIVAAPGAPRATGTQLWTAQRRPVLRWQPSSDSWAPPRYTVYLDGSVVATTSATSYATPAALPDGRHSWKVVASDALGQEASSTTRRLLIDAARPSVLLRIAGPRTAGQPLGFTVSTGAPSGLRSVSIGYGDGTSAAAARSTHAYAHAGSYVVSVTLTDRAGVSAVARRVVAVS